MNKNSLTKKGAKLLTQFFVSKKLLSMSLCFFNLKLVHQRAIDKIELNKFKNAQMAELDKQRRKHQKEIEDLSSISS